MRREILFLVLVFISAFLFGVKFRDVPKTHWAYEAVTEVVKAGLMQGYPDGTFKGDKKVTRYELAVMLYKLLKRMEKKKEITSELAGKGNKLVYSYTRLFDFSPRSSVEDLRGKVRVKVGEDVYTFWIKYIEEWHDEFFYSLGFLIKVFKNGKLYKTKKILPVSLYDISEGAIISMVELSPFVFEFKVISMNLARNKIKSIILGGKIYRND